MVYQFGSLSKFKMVKQTSKKRKLEKKQKVTEIPHKSIVALPVVPVIDLTADADEVDAEEENEEDDDDDAEDSDINSDGIEELEILYSVNPGGNVYILIHSSEPHATYKKSRTNNFGSQDTEILGVFSSLNTANNEAYKYLKETFDVDKDDTAIVDSCVNGWALKDDECDPKVLNDHVYVIVQKLR
jgi:hypothetical protein